MTPEAVYDLGKRAAVEHLIDAMGPVFNGTIDGIIRDLEDAAFDNAPAWLSTPEKVLLAAHFLRGAAEHFGDIMRETQARAATLESTR